MNKTEDLRHHQQLRKNTNTINFNNKIPYCFVYYDLPIRLIAGGPLAPQTPLEPSELPNAFDFHGQSMAKPGPSHGQAMAKPWPGHGQAIAKPWPGHGQAMAKPWPGHSQAMAEPWPSHG